MGLFGKILKVSLDVVTSPIAVIKDVATLGGTTIDKPSAIGKKIRQIGNDFDEIRDEVDSL